MNFSSLSCCRIFHLSVASWTGQKIYISIRFSRRGSRGLQSMATQCRHCLITMHTFFRLSEFQIQQSLLSRFKPTKLGRYSLDHNQYPSFSHTTTKKEKKNYTHLYTLTIYKFNQNAINTTKLRRRVHSLPFFLLDL